MRCAKCNNEAFSYRWDSDTCFNCEEAERRNIATLSKVSEARAAGKKVYLHEVGGEVWGFPLADLPAGALPVIAHGRLWADYDGNSGVTPMPNCRDNMRDKYRGYVMAEVSR